MQKCYLVVITRNKWHDYQLITDLPPSLDRPRLYLKKNIKSFFPLDYVDKSIAASSRLVDENIHLQMWCGLINAFDLQGIPYVEQIGRPIKLGVGILQELDENYAFQRYSLADIRGLLVSKIIGYQSAKNHEPRLVELHELNLHGILSYYESSVINAADVASPMATARVDQCNQELPAEHNDRLDNWMDDNLSADCYPSSAAETDDLLYLVLQSLALRDVLARYSAGYTSKAVQYFMDACTKSQLFQDPEKVIHGNRRKAFVNLIDAWSMPLEKRIGLAKIFFPSWRPPAQGISANKRDILNRRLDNLSIFMAEDPSPADVEDDFERIADTFYSLIIEMLDD